MKRFARVGRLFARNEKIDTARTVAHFSATPDDVWLGMLFYEEIPHRPTPFLRMLLPVPLRTEGKKTSVDAIIRCTYDDGYLEKCITALEKARLVQFRVVVQRLGIEDCVSVEEGAYEISATDDGSRVILTTRYRGHLRPRWFWRPFERYVAGCVHRHILDGMRAALEDALTREERTYALPSLGSEP